MEVQEGKGPWARQVGGLVPIGSPLTLVIAINDHSREFDMRIKRCTASDGTGSEIELTDDRGCVIRSSLLTPFTKIRDFGGKATLVAYSHLFAFKFPDKMDVFVHCIVEVCRHGCPDSCSHQHKNYEHQGAPYGSLESKKIQKLAELAGSKSIHEIHVLGQHQHLQSSDLGGEYPLPGRERIREILIPAAQTQVQHFTLKNGSNIAAVENAKLVKGDTKASFSPAAFKAAQKAKETKSQEQSASSNVHNVFIDVENSLHAEKESKFDFQVLQEHQEKPVLNVLHHHQEKPILNVLHQHHEKPILNVLHQHQEKPILNGLHQHQEKPNLNVLHQQQIKPILNVAHEHQERPTLTTVHQHQEKPGVTAHRIIGHDVHWISETVGKLEDDHASQLLKDISHQVPKPEPAAWSADEVKPLTKLEVLHHQKPQIDTSIHHYHSNTPYVSKIQWSSDNSKSKEVTDAILLKQVPQPEPATWSADEVKPLSKPEILHQQKPQLDTNIHHYHSHSHSPYISKIHWSSDNSKPKETVDSILQKHVPQPEPATWTLEEVNPMHSPQAVRQQLHTKRPEEPKPEPSAWSLDDVKGFNKEDLRVLSLNHKMKSHAHITAPVYKEYVSPYSTTILPQPVYISRGNPRNISNPNMMKMMMMMPTMLPPTYQTAYWPQRTTARYLRPQRHHYPYPIPQFSPHQQMMMSVIADRRMDDEGEDLQAEDLSLYHNLNKGDTEAGVKRIQIGETASEPKSSSDNKSVDHLDENITTQSTTLEDVLHEMISELGMNGNDQTSSESKITEDILKKAIMSEPSETVVTVLVHELTPTPQSVPSKETIDGTSGARSAISSFLPPSLDTEVGADPETKDRLVPAPRSLERNKRSSEPVFGVRQKFQAIAPSDLAFEWNLTTDGATVLRGIREEIVYGICISPAGMSASVGFILILTLLSIIASVVFYEHSCKLTNKTSQLAFFTRNFNGQFEALYKFTRPYLYSASTNVR